MRETAKKIVLVEDDQAFGLAFTAALSASGYLVTHLQDHSAFLEMMANQQRPVADLFLIDFHLPGLMGDSVTRIFLKNDQSAHVPVLLVSGLGETELRTRAQAAGADGYLCKSWGLKRLVDGVRELLDARR